jgi:HAD superfamily phosphoserine phosphatase-like hydrolase
MIRISIYDMDKTITRAATFGPFLRYGVPRVAPWRVVLVPVVLLVTLAYGLRLIGRGALKETNLALLMGRRINAAKLAETSAGFASQMIAKNMLRGALDQIAADRAAGYRIVIASASYGFYVTEIARLIGIDAIVATHATMEGDDVRPKIDGENCYADAKLAMVKNWCAAQGIERASAHIRFYSDHMSDAPCLDWADEAFAANPHPPLRRLAAHMGWTIVDWA